MLEPVDPTPEADGTFRATSRVLLFDEHDRVLMFLQYGKSHDVAPRWITPGGGVDPGEDWHEAGLRELQEETGLMLGDLPDPFLVEAFEPDQRWHPYQRGAWAWYAVRVPHFDYVTDGWTDEEQVDVLEGRWIGLDEWESLEHEVEPATLAALVRHHIPEE